MSSDDPMSDVFEVGVITFNNADAADRVIGGLRKRGATRLVNDVAALEHHDSGRFSVHTYSAETTRGEHVGRGAAVGALVGMLLGPLGLFVGLVGGGALGATMGGPSAHDLGLSDDFVAKLKESLPPGSSAVIILGEPDVVDQLVGEVRATDMVTANEFRHTMTEAQAQAIRAAIESGKGAAS